jgi:hypothetical protein
MSKYAKSVVISKIYTGKHGEEATLKPLDRVVINRFTI